MPDETAMGLIEIESRADAQSYERLRHAMEYDADRSALWMLVRLQEIDLEPVSGLSAFPKSLRLKLAIFAAAIMTFMFDQAARRLERRNTATHPAAQYRLVDLVRTLASNLVEPTGEVKQAFHSTLNEMIALQVNLPEFISATRLMDDVRSTRLQRELDEIDDGLADARISWLSFVYKATRSTS